MQLPYDHKISRAVGNASYRVAGFAGVTAERQTYELFESGLETISYPIGRYSRHGYG